METTETAAAVYRRGRWLVSNVSDVRIMWIITTYHFGTNAVTVKRADRKGTKVLMTWVD
jgi:hypothetical protein